MGLDYDSTVMLTCKLLFAAASGIRRWHDEKQATYSAHLHVRGGDADWQRGYADT